MAFSSGAPVRTLATSILENIPFDRFREINNFIQGLIKEEVFGIKVNDEKVYSFIE
ncbi:MAG TPA: hypothetical protein PLH43_04760 [Acetivibrio sp.]|uniref:hypothetical protein n=1 Tax=Acetivibrio sp. TaxID=1872092 RepID=UPI002CF94EB3|nr:hypothetical protein [Acetivibrio sp.]HOM02121.1 hypothetical protein [Acetivibrio sp.]